MEFKPKAKSTIRPVPLQRRAESLGAVTQQPTRISLEQRLQRFTSTPVQAQHQAVRPVLQAAGLRQREERHVALQRQNLTKRAGTPQPASRSGEQALLHQQAPPPPIPRQPQSPADWVTVMCAQAEQIEGRVTSAREAAQFSALQRQVAQTLVQGFRADRRPAQERHDSYAAHLVALQRHPSSAPVAGVVLGLIPQGERPALQRAVDLTLQREQAQAAQDQQAPEALAIQRQLAELDAEATQPVLQRIQARRGSGNPLPAAVRRHLEQGLNHDLSRVRIHDDAEADKLAKGVNAVAFTTGTDIFFRRGQFNPNTRTGLELLAHEVTHTVQQSQGRVGSGIDPDAGLEGEARTTGAQLARTFQPASFLPPAARARRAARPLRPLTVPHAAGRPGLQRSPWGDLWKTVQDKAVAAALDLAAQVPNGATIVAAFRRSQGVFQKLLADPGAFFGHLMGAVKNGFGLFRKNIAKHLETALLDWLTGTTLRATGGLVAFPKSLDGKELLGLGMNLLGLNTQGLLARLGQRYGVENVQKAQGQLAVLQQARQGLHHLNEFRALDGKAKDGMLTAARDYAIQTVAQQAVIWVSGFITTGGLGPVAKAAFSLVSTFLQNAQTFGRVASGVLNSVQDISAGRLDTAAQTVERNLGLTTGLVLKFASKLLGLDKIGGALRRGLSAVQKPINTAIDKIVGSKPVQLVFQKLKTVGATAGRSVGNIWNSLRAAGGMLTGRLPVKGTRHHLWVEIQGNRPEVIMASNPLPLRQQLAQMEKEASAFLTGTEKAQVDAAQARANVLVDQGIGAMLKYLQTRPNRANPAADETWLAANKSVIRGKLADLGKDTISKVNAQIAPAVAILDQRILPVKDLSAAVASGGGIVAFLRTLSQGGTVQGINQQAFSTLWGRKSAGTFAHRERIITLFRAAMPGHHEWIPSDLIEEVVARDLNAHQLGQASNWVKFQHRTRTLTQHVVFKTERSLAGKSVPQGHSGAIYLRKTSRTGNVTYKPETEGQEQFHEELRTAFRRGATHAAVVADLKAVILRSLWDGTGQFKQVIHPECVWRAQSGQYLELGTNFSQVASTIATQYSQIMGVIK